LTKIENTKSIYDQIEYIIDIKNQGCGDWENILISCVTSKNISLLQDNEYINIITECYSKFQLDLSTVINITMNVLDNKYRHYFDTSNIANIIMCSKFWDSVIINSKNQYSTHIFIMKKMLDKYIRFAIYELDNKDCVYDPVIENFIFNLFEEIFPNEIMIQDQYVSIQKIDLINIYHVFYYYVL
jgi:hypothetical protein